MRRWAKALAWRGGDLQVRCAERLSVRRGWQPSGGLRPSGILARQHDARAGKSAAGDGASGGPQGLRRVIVSGYNPRPLSRQGLLPACLRRAGGRGGSGCPRQPRSDRRRQSTTDL
ncbi:hypothetical protein OF001_U140048 [Pseudomonas sp. OF001]|nr:hypothetical protein OF001_U140048 [Pseudomonas sp. OF001]